MGRVIDKTAQFRDKFERQMQRNFDDAARLLTRKIKARIRKARRPGVPSRPFHPPHSQTGTLKASIGWDRTPPTAGMAIVRKVGPTVLYGYYLEEGTRKMWARPYIKSTFRANQGEIKRILTRKVQ